MRDERVHSLPQPRQPCDSAELVAQLVVGGGRTRETLANMPRNAFGNFVTVNRAHAPTARALARRTPRCSRFVEGARHAACPRSGHAQRTGNPPRMATAHVGIQLASYLGMCHRDSRSTTSRRGPTGNHAYARLRRLFGRCVGPFGAPTDRWAATAVVARIDLNGDGLDDLVLGADDPSTSDATAIVRAGVPGAMGHL